MKERMTKKKKNTIKAEIKKKLMRNIKRVKE